MGRNSGIHPAIVELRRYFHQRGDVDVVAFMQRWMASWLDVAYYQFELSAEELDTLATKAKEERESFMNQMTQKAFSELGKTIGPTASVCEVERDLACDSEKYRYAVMVVRAEKKVVLEQ